MRYFDKFRVNNPKGMLDFNPKVVAGDLRYAAGCLFAGKTDMFGFCGNCAVNAYVRLKEGFSVKIKVIFLLAVGIALTAHAESL